MPSRRTLGGFGALLLAIAWLLTTPAPAVAQGVAPPPSIFFRTGTFIGAFTPGVIGYQVVVPSGGVTLEWMQLVPGPARIYWNDLRFVPPATPVRTFWSARPDGSDVRPEPDLFGARIGPSGDWKYRYDEIADRFVRSRLDGSDPELLGFGGNATGERIPFVDDDEAWLYFFGSDLTAPPSTPNPRLAILRGHIATGAVEQLWVPGSRFLFGGFEMILDPIDDLIHLNGNGTLHDEQFPSADSSLYQFDLSASQQVGYSGFDEGEGTIQQVALDPANRDYYFTLPGGFDHQPLRRLAYDDLGVQFPHTAPIVFADPAIGAIRQLDSHPTIRVPEPASASGSLFALAATFLLVRWRRRIA